MQSFLHSGRNRFRAAGDQRGGDIASSSQLDRTCEFYSPSGADCALACHAGRVGHGSCSHLSLGPEPRNAALALGHLGQRRSNHPLASSIRLILLLCFQFRTFNETYGSLGAVIGFMTWIWISAIVNLIGAELDAEMEHQTARDTCG
jgi:hypothetical protein